MRCSIKAASIRRWARVRCGARIGRLIEAPIAEMLLKGELDRGDIATVDVENGVIVVDAVSP